MYHLSCGFYSDNFEPNLTVRQLLIDEAQDLSGISTRHIVKSVPYATFTVLADPRQAVFPVLASYRGGSALHCIPVATRFS